MPLSARVSKMTDGRPDRGAAFTRGRPGDRATAFFGPGVPGDDRDVDQGQVDVPEDESAVDEALPRGKERPPKAASLALMNLLAACCGFCSG